MEDLLAQFFAAHPRFLVHVVEVVIVGMILALVWKAIPATMRQAWELKHPRAVGFIRVVCELMPGILGAALAFYFQILKGLPKHPEPPAPTPAVVETTPGESAR